MPPRDKLQAGHFPEMAAKIKIAFNAPIPMECAALSFPAALPSSRNSPERAESATFSHTNLFVTHSGCAEMPFSPLVSQPPSPLARAPPSPYVPPVHRARLELPQSP